MLAKWLPASSPLARAQHGEDAAWGLGEQLLAEVADTLRAANWQRGGGKGRRPRRIPRPGVDGGVTVEQIGGSTTYTPDEMRALIDRHTRGGT